VLDEDVQSCRDEETVHDVCVCKTIVLSWIKCILYMSMYIEGVDHITRFGGIQRLRFLSKTNQLLQRELQVLPCSCSMAVSNKCFFALRPQSHLELLMSQKWVLLDCSRKKGMCHRRAAISVCYEGGALRSVRVSYLEETTLSPQLLWVMSGKRQGNAFGFLGKSRLLNLLPTFTETHFVLHCIHMVFTKKSIDL